MGGRRTVVSLLLPIAVLGVAATDARATLRVENHIDPAGDPTVISYRIEGPTLSPSLDFTLTDGDDRSFGPPAGAYTARALLPAGWETADIQCVGPRPEAMVTDVANARVTLQHGTQDEQTCAFTNRRIPPNGAPPTPGVEPSPPASELPEVVLPDRPAVLRVVAGHRFAAATIRLMRRAVLRGRLLTAGGRVLGAKRIERDAGTHTLRVRIAGRDARGLRRRGRDRVTLTFRIAMTERGRGTRVVRHRVIVRL